MLSASLNRLVRVLLAPTCAACDTLLDHPLLSPICNACWRAIHAIRAPSCARCGDALPGWLDELSLCGRCEQTPPHFSIARSVGHYDDALREIVQAFKYGGRRVLAAPLASMMRDHGRNVLTGADAVVPVPLHPWRTLRRGFNQADDLALHLGLPVWRALRRARQGPPQASLPAAHRHANVRDAFRLARRVAAPGWRRRLAGRTVVLVDDVMTTGATLDACAQVLSDAGARDVRALTVARAVVAPHERPLRPRRLSTAPRR